MKVLIVEDNKELSQSITAYLGAEGYLCEVAPDYATAEEKISLYSYDCILIDLGLPGGNGLDLVQVLKNIKSRSGVIIISAKGSVDDRVKGLELGSDDYLPKPFHLSELSARMKALIRRKNFEGNTEIRLEELYIDPTSQITKVHDRVLALTKKEYDLLLYFVTNKNRVLTKNSIAEHLWGDDMDQADEYDFIYTHIKNLRKKITESGGKDRLETVYGMGYKFSAP
ncbi:MAG TPA: response regulator transcription factor [Bacteroidia bacterium]|nr:response regulator transcription factor [Bacteroidia bacterium]